MPDKLNLTEGAQLLDVALPESIETSRQIPAANWNLRRTLEEMVITQIGVCEKIINAQTKLCCLADVSPC
jgi:hypothetical protein